MATKKFTIKIGMDDADRQAVADDIIEKINNGELTVQQNANTTIYDNTKSGLEATNVKEALDELAEKDKNQDNELARANGEIVDLKNALFGTILDTQEQDYENVGVATIDRANDYPIVSNQKAQLTKVKGRTEVRPIRNIVDLGGLNYNLYEGLITDGHYIYWAQINDLALNGELRCSKLTQVPQVFNTAEDYSMSSHGSLHRVYIKLDNSYTTTEAVKQALNGVILEYDTPENEVVNVNITTLKSYREYAKVDLGTLAWHYQADHKRFTTDGISSIVKPRKGTEIANVKCVLYEPLNLFAFDNEAYANSKVIAIYENGVIYIKNPDYTDVATFKQAMSDVILYFEPNEPTNAELIGEVHLSTGDLNGINEAVDEATETTKTRVIGSVKIKDIEWNTTGNAGVFGAVISDFKSTGSYIVKSNLKSAKYENVEYQYLTDTTKDKIITSWSDAPTVVYIKDTRYTDTATFVQENGEEVIYYELATPVIEEGFGEVLIHVERGGSVETDSNADITLNHVVFKPLEE